MIFETVTERCSWCTSVVVRARRLGKTWWVSEAGVGVEQGLVGTTRRKCNAGRSKRRTYLAQISRGSETWSVGGGLHDQPAFCLRSHEPTVRGREKSVAVCLGVSSTVARKCDIGVKFTSGIQVKSVERDGI